MHDPMLGELYKRVFEMKYAAEALAGKDSETADRRRQVALAKNQLLSELIDIRTDQIRSGRDGSK